MRFFGEGFFKRAIEKLKGYRDGGKRKSRFYSEPKSIKATNCNQH